MTTVRLRAAWVLPVDHSPIPNAIVEFANGRLTDVRAAQPHETAEDLGDVAILPGLVNAHTHLEFSLVEHPFEPAQPFTNWIRSLVAYRRQTFGSNPFAKKTALQAGWREAASDGTTLIGEIATDDWPTEALHGVGPRTVAFRELIGMRSETIAQQIATAESWLADRAQQLAIGSGRGPNCLPALSPHAPYSVAPELLIQSVQLAKRSGAPVAMHLAETREELEFLADARGDLVEMLQAFGAYPEFGLPAGRRPLDILRVLADSPRALVVHGNYLADDEIAFLAARPQMSVIYCPRTHEYFGHEPHPWQSMLAGGVNVALGTDGRGSNPDLSLWSELVFLRSRFSHAAPTTLLEMGTINGARALGFDRDCGTLTPGKRADLAIVSLPNNARDPNDWLFSEVQQVVAVFVDGLKLPTRGELQNQIATRTMPRL